MIQVRLARLRDRVRQVLPERHLYIRSGGEMRCVTLSTRRQCGLAVVSAILAVWLSIASAAALSSLMPLPRPAYAAAPAAAPDPQLQLASEVERRHEALALVLSELDPSAAAADLPAGAAPAERVRRIRQDQARLLAIADQSAKARAQRLRLAFRSAGISPSRFSRAQAQGGPLIAVRDPKVLASLLQVDEDFAARIQQASASLHELRTLSDAALRLPLGHPVDRPQRSSGYGLRQDPFTGEPAFHSGLDFSGAYKTPIKATAAGRVAYVGPRSGYGRVVEIDHGGGVKTRYGHLQSASVAPGQQVLPGQRIGAMGSTGRSTGVHLHYEVWVNGRPQNPARFLRAGERMRADA